jgi:polyhydroxyalkanoate synthesis regulator phasin
VVTKDDLQKYLEAGIAFTNITRAKAEDIVNDLVGNGDFPSIDARAKVEELLEWSKRGSELLVAQVRHEVSRQLEGVGSTNLDELARQVASLLGWPVDGASSETPTDPGSEVGVDEPGHTTDKKTTQKQTKKKASKPKSAAGKKKKPGKSTVVPLDTGSTD